MTKNEVLGFGRIIGSKTLGTYLTSKMWRVKFWTKDGQSGDLNIKRELNKTKHLKFFETS